MQYYPYLKNYFFQLNIVEIRFVKTLIFSKFPITLRFANKKLVCSVSVFFFFLVVVVVVVMKFLFDLQYLHSVHN